MHRYVFIPLSALAFVAGCADVPITAEQVESNGQLRASNVSVFDASSTPATGITQPIQLTSVLALEPEGALQDRAEFASAEREIHLHLRTDRAPEGWTAPHVSVVWSHGERSTETPVTLKDDHTLALASSLPIAPGDEGAWTVTVYADEAEGRVTLMERAFEITP